MKMLILLTLLFAPMLCQAETRQIPQLPSQFGTAMEASKEAASKLTEAAAAYCASLGLSSITDGPACAAKIIENTAITLGKNRVLLPDAK